MKLSNDLMQEYRRIKSNSIDIQVQVLTSTYWPISQQTTSCRLPKVLYTAQEEFTKFYLSKHNGRKLTFHLNMGTVEVRTWFGEKRHDLVIPTFAMAILDLFEHTNDWISYETIQQTTQLPEDDLQRMLYALTHPKHPILLQQPNDRETPKEGYQYSFNRDFKSKMVRIRIAPAAPKLERVAERKVTLERINEERQVQTDACIVRVMKARQTLEHNVLVAEVAQQLLSRFQPDPSMIKKRIESLIERDYLERSKDNL
jgi:cullin 3